MTIAVVFLVMVALIVTMVGCTQPAQYGLTISATEGGEITTPGEGTFSYDKGTTVPLVALPHAGYRFVNWTGDVSTVGDLNAASTTITMNSHYEIIANFALKTPGIHDWYDLDAVRGNLTGSYMLMNDLDSATPGYDELAGPTANEGKGWQPIGTESDSFVGSLDGQGYEIRDLFITRLGEDLVGLFGIVEEGGRVEHISLVNAMVTAWRVVGGLVGFNAGTVSDSRSSSSVLGFQGVGRLIGINYGTVNNSSSGGNVTGVGAGQSVGGLIGENQGTVSNSYSSGNVTGETGARWVGGLTGYNGGTVSNSYSNATVTGWEFVGGLVGLNAADGSVSNSYSTGSVTGTSGAGGLVASNDGTVSNSFWDMKTSGQPTSAGGIGKTTVQMKSVTTFSGAAWDIVTVANTGIRNASYAWNIVDGQTYPFLSWQSAS